MRNVYFSVDIETLGLCAGLHSMISLGAAALDIDTGEIVGTWKGNLKPLPDLQPDNSKPSGGLSVAEFWQKFPEAYKRATENAQDAAIVIPNFVKWVQCFGIAYPVVAAWKPGFDIAFLRYYLYRFVGGDIFGRGGSGLDIKTLAAIASGQSFSNTRIGELNCFKAPDLTNHTHDALDDAIEQAHVLFYARRHLGSAL
jgi:hypothetical protein